ncbi:lipase maturation factor 2-like isoform X2 [Gouania willdenowi]|uniref:lipase maturation factor 2-like isoform X2 n=1 Tax=Gouania willdenowi TaxID=441366 RepID=UPI001054CB88|nr:lipase maturation factor 2-like isoform X2 [Gouania willdenowi]
MMEVSKPRRLFLWCMAAIYMVAFVSLYVQIPGLYGNEGLLPARLQLRYGGRSLTEQLRSSPTLLWLGPHLSLDTQASMELLCLLGALLSLAALLVEALRDSLVFLCLWVSYLSMYQVGQVFLYFQWDSLLLETGFLTVLVAPLTLVRGSRGIREHDSMTFWLVRWLLFRLMFVSGAVKLTSRCPTWWGLTALTYHYETQCIPTPLAWFAHQLPVWWHKLSVVATFVIEIAAPFLFFSPLRRLRLGAFYLQVLLQTLIILSGNYNFFNLLTLTLCLSLLDNQHVNFWLRKRDDNRERKEAGSSERWSWICYLLELVVWSLIIFGTIVLFDLQFDPHKNGVSSRTAFTFHHFNQFLKAVTIPCIWMGVLSLIWEMITSIFRCACVSGFLTRFWGMFQWSVFAVAATFMFTISLVPLSYVEHDSHVRLWPAVRQTYDLVDRFQLVNSYGLFRRMTGVGGRPEVVLEGSYDGVTWKEIEFMYKPGNVSAPPAVVTPHQPRLDWQMWFAALGAHTQAPWFTSLVYRLLQGKADVIELIQTDVSQYPFHQQPPTYVRAHRYRYWFTERKPDGSHQARWWRRVYDEEFYPMVHLGHTYLENMLSRYGLKDKLPPRHPSNNTVVQLLSWTRSQVKGIPAHTIIWTMLACSATWCFLMGLISNKNHTAVDLIDEAEKQGDEKSVAKQEKEEEVEKDQDVCTNQEGEEEEEDRDGDEQDKEDEMEK